MRSPLCLSWRSVGWIVGLALLARFVCSAASMQTWVDGKVYQACAQALLEGQWAEFRPERTPGYPLFLAFHMRVLAGWAGGVADSLLFNAVGISQALLGILTALLTADLAVRMTRKPSIGLLAGLVAALSPNLLFYEHAVLTETLYAFSLILTVWWAVRIGPRLTPGNLVILGLLTGWLIWIRPAGLVLVVIGVWLLGRQGNRAGLIAFLIPVLVFCGLWTVFQVTTHRYVGLAAGGGLNQLYKTIDFTQWDSLLHQDFKAVLRQRAAMHPDGLTLNAVNDAHILHTMRERSRPAGQVYLEDDRVAREISMEAIAARPLLYLWVTGREAFKLLSDPTHWDPHLAYGLPLWVLAAVGSLRLWRRRVLVWGSRWLVLALWGQMLLYPLMTTCIGRYRVPLEPLMAVAAAYAGVGLCLAFRKTGPARKLSGD